MRKTQKLTQEELARLVCITTQHISNIETGRNFPSLLILISILKELDCELYYIQKKNLKITHTEELRKSVKSRIDDVDEITLKLLDQVIKSRHK